MLFIGAMKTPHLRERNMNPVDHFQKLFQYDYWGNCESVATLSSAGAQATAPLKIFGHVVGAQRVWLSRILRTDAGSNQPWPVLTIEESRAAVDNLRQQWNSFLSSLKPERLSEGVSYRNTQGVEFNTPLEDVLQHVILHSAYHRGQVAAFIRQAGGKPANTDYVAYIRQHRTAG
jgi:uncharacterized damage-inducible protein DinB